MLIFCRKFTEEYCCQQKMKDEESKGQSRATTHPRVYRTRPAVMAVKFVNPYRDVRLVVTRNRQYPTMELSATSQNRSFFKMYFFKDTLYINYDERRGAGVKGLRHPTSLSHGISLDLEGETAFTDLRKLSLVHEATSMFLKLFAEVDNYYVI